MNVRFWLTPVLRSDLSRRHILRMEQLEARDVPSITVEGFNDFGGDSFPDGDGGGWSSNFGIGDLGDDNSGEGPPGGWGSAFQISNVTVTQLSYNQFRIVGQVSGSNTGGLNVAFSGAIVAAGYTDFAGNFDITATANSIGVVTIVVGDGLTESDPYYAQLTNSAPSLSGLSIVQIDATTWTFSGTVTDEAPGGLTVTFSGPNNVEGSTATVSTNGAFSLTLTCAVGTSGTVSATVTDWWGLTATAFNIM